MAVGSQRGRRCTFLRRFEKIKHQHGAVPARAVSWVVTIVEQQLLSCCNLPLRLRARNHTVARVVEEPLSAVVVKAVVHLVAKCGAVVARLNQVS